LNLRQAGLAVDDLSAHNKLHILFVPGGRSRTLQLGEIAGLNPKTFPVSLAAAADRRRYDRGLVCNAICEAQNDCVMRIIFVAICSELSINNSKVSSAYLQFF
jgi:hypothetical protein